MSAPTFYIPELAKPTPILLRDDRRSPTSSFSSSKGPRLAGVPFEDGRFSRASTLDSLIPPPPYPRDFDEESRVPGYGEEQEIRTLAQYLFKYGFMFPPFWFLGALILFSSLNPDPDWYATKSEEHVDALLKAMRTAERRWAWRCAIAFGVFLFIILIVVGSLLLARHFGRI